MKCGQNPIVHVHPNRTSPIWCVMLRVTFHVDGAEAIKNQNLFQFVPEPLAINMNHEYWLYYETQNEQT